MHNPVFPNSPQLEDMREQVRERLHTSLDHLIFEVFSPEYGVRVERENVRRILLDGPTYPGARCFALHGVLLQAALTQDNTHLPRVFAMLDGFFSRDQGEPDGVRVSGLGDRDLHPDDVWLLQLAFQDDVGLTTALTQPSENDCAAAAGVIAEAYDLLDRLAPKWAAELRSLAREIYLATSGISDRPAFAGAAVFDAFGGLMLNPYTIAHADVTALALVHEASHQQMFLFHLDDPVVLNGPDAVFSSPLRKEPRPMEGIFHAMWVSARMALVAHAMRMAEPDGLYAPRLGEMVENSLKAYRDGAATVEAHGELTEFGQVLLQGSRDATLGL